MIKKIVRRNKESNQEVKDPEKWEIEKVLREAEKNKSIEKSYQDLGDEVILSKKQYAIVRCMLENPRLNQTELGLKVGLPQGVVSYHLIQARKNNPNTRLAKKIRAFDKRDKYSFYKL